MEFKRASDMIQRMVDITLTGTQQINDFTEGSVTLTLYEAIATQIEQLYVLSQQNIQDGIEEGIYSAFGFSRTPAQKAYGSLTLTLNSYFQSDFTIPKGLQFAQDNPEYSQVYETLDSYIIPQGVASVSVPVYCTEAGSVGNIPANTINKVMSFIGNVDSVTNPLSFQTGQDEEDLSSVKNRFRAYIASIGRATKKAIEFGLRQITGVAGVYVDEQVGYIKVYVHDLNGDLPDDLKTKVESTLEYYRPAGIPVDIFPIEKHLFSLDMTITLNDKTQATDAYANYIEGVIEGYLNSRTVSQDFILSSIISLVKNVDQNNIYDVTLTKINDSVSGDKPVGNVIVEDDALIRSGAISVTFA